MTLFPTNYFYYMYYLYKLSKNQKLTTLEIKHIQNIKLKNLLKYAYLNVDYYRKLFHQAGIVLSDIKTIDDIHKIPITTKEDIQKCSVTEILSKRRDIHNCTKYFTSGTTNEPFEIYVSKDEEILQGMLYLRMLFTNGYKRTDRLVVLTHPQFIKRKRKHIFQHLGFFDIEYLSIFQDPKECIKNLLEIKPDVIRGYTPAIKVIASEIRARNIKGIHPYLIFCTAEFLSENDRDFIGNAFEAELIDYYSSTDCGLIAWECRQHTGYHINTDNIIIEIINNNKKVPREERGEVVITNLNSYTMPFIRYRIGDEAILSENLCSCGVNFPLIKAIIKRSPSKQLIAK